MGVNIDRLSSLPDSLLSMIVSSLPFKEAVRTSILSKSWLKIPRSTSNIEFDESFFVKIDQPDEIVEAQRSAFFDFIEDWIDNHKNTVVVDKFSLRLMIPDVYGEVIKQCTAFAMNNGVKDLQLDLTYPLWNKNYDFSYDFYEASVELPLHAYTNSLQNLKLFQCSFDETHLHNFHSLKEVSLGYLKIEMSSIRALLTSCKMLESLSLTKCFSSTMFDLEEECLGLRKLVIQNCHLNFKLFRVNAPNLKVFKFSGKFTVFPVDIRAPELEEAELDFSAEYEYKKHGYFLYNFMIELYTARVLVVCSYLLQVIPTGTLHQGMQRYMKAKHLIMKTALHENEFIGITFVLNSCPFLECLTIEMGSEKHLLGFEPEFNFNPDRFWIDKASVYKCMRLNLKKLEFRGFTGTTNEICLLSYFIMRGKALKKISVDILKDEVTGNDNSMAHRREMADLLLMLPKATVDLEISIN